MWRTSSLWHTTLAKDRPESAAGPGAGVCVYVCWFGYVGVCVCVCVCVLCLTLNSSNVETCPSCFKESRGLASNLNLVGGAIHTCLCRSMDMSSWDRLLLSVIFLKNGGVWFLLVRSSTNFIALTTEMSELKISSILYSLSKCLKVEIFSICVWVVRIVFVCHELKNVGRKF